MNPDLYLGIAIGTAVPWIITWICGAILKRDAGKKLAPANELLRERNEIGERQAAALEEIHCLVQKVAFWEADRLRRVRLNSPSERRERIAVAALQAIPHVGCGADLDTVDLASAAYQLADAMLAEREKKNP